MTIGCNASDGVISSVDFASFGQPIGSCAHGGFNKSHDPSCHANTSQSVVEKACLGKIFCSVPASAEAFLPGKSCASTRPQSLAVEISCGRPRGRYSLDDPRH